jgi:hypothetical protein
MKKAEKFDEIPEGKSYLACDKNLQPIVVLDADAFSKAWGSDYGSYIVKTTTENIDTVARFVKPDLSIDARRHSCYRQSALRIQFTYQAQGSHGEMFVGKWSRRQLGFGRRAQCAAVRPPGFYH